MNRLTSLVVCPLSFHFFQTQSVELKTKLSFNACIMSFTLTAFYVYSCQKCKHKGQTTVAVLTIKCDTKCVEKM